MAISLNEYNFKFDEDINIKENVKKLPKLKSRKVEWQKSKQRSDNVIELGYPIYDKEVENIKE